jgi:hypothetical protein
LAIADRSEFAEFAHRLGEAPQHQIGWWVEHKAAQHISNATDLGLIGAIAIGIPGTELGDLALGASLAGKEIAAIRQRQEVLRAALDDAQPMFVQLQVADDLGLQQADGVSRSRGSEAGMEFLGNTGTADHAAPLKNTHPQARHAKIGRTGQPVVTGAD